MGRPSVAADIRANPTKLGSTVPRIGEDDSRRHCRTLRFSERYGCLHGISEAHALAFRRESGSMVLVLGPCLTASAVPVPTLYVRNVPPERDAALEAAA
jgi:hypothetical protein